MKIGIIGDLIVTPEARHDPYLLNKLTSTDFNIANLESPFIRESFKQKNKKGGLYQRMNNCEQLKKLNIQVVSLANNHMFDFGAEGLLETIHVLENEQIGYFGAGQNRERASELTEIRCGEKTVAFGGYVSSYIKPHNAKTGSPGTAPLDERMITTLLDKSEADIKIIYNHWNQEYEDYPEPLYLDMSRRLIRHCDVIIGAHPHCIQGIQVQNGKPVFHSIGNFTLPHRKYHLKTLQKFPDHCYEAFFVILHIDDDKRIRYEKVPYKILDGGCHIAEMSREEAADLEEKCENISQPLDLDIKTYYRFYRKRKRRKFRPILRRNHTRNKLNLWFTFLILASVQRITVISARVLDYLGIRKFIRTRFAFLLNRILKL